jgi:citrate lyase beta subunit
MTSSLSAASLESVVAPLQKANARFASLRPGESGARQPVHTVYGGAHIFKKDTAARLGELALRSLREYGPEAPAFANAVGMGGDEAMRSTVYARMLEKLEREPVEDFRIDFEDGYGNRPDDEEDACAASAAGEVAAGMAEGSLPPFIGIRIKPLSRELCGRSLRTLDIFLTTLAERTGGALPGGFVVTLPKVVIPEQVQAAVGAVERIETATSLAEGSVKIELMIETPQSIIDTEGRSNLPILTSVARERCIGAHFGVYDYTASLCITAEHQKMGHPACDAARNAMQVALAGMGLFLSDGATNVMPVPVHRAEKGGPGLTPAQLGENAASVHKGWRLHFADVRHSLENAFFQGWDLHPAQLPTRYAALYSYFLESLTSSSDRLRNFVEKAAQATLLGDVFDDAATGQGLLNFFLRGLNCGAITPDEAAATGLTLEEFNSRSFLRILEERKRRPG